MCADMATALWTKENSGTRRTTALTAVAAGRPLIWHRNRAADRWSQRTQLARLGIMTHSGGSRWFHRMIMYRLWPNIIAGKEKWSIMFDFLAITLFL